MVPKRSSTTTSRRTKNATTSFVLLMLVNIALVSTFLQTDAAPIARLLSITPPPSSSSSSSSASSSGSFVPQLSEAQLLMQAPPSSATQPSFRRAQIQRRDQQTQQQPQPRHPSFTSSMFRLQPQSEEQQLRSWRFDSTLRGHAVLDDEDDDAGNELLDTETDGLLRPDADDEIEGTVEGEAFEEEEEDEDEDEDESDDEEDEDMEDEYMSMTSLEEQYNASMATDRLWKGMIHRLSSAVGLNRHRPRTSGRSDAFIALTA